MPYVIAGSFKAAALLLIFIVFHPEISNAQLPFRVGSEFTILEENDDVTGGFGFTAYADWLLSATRLLIFFRPGYEFINSEPQPGQYSSTKYYRHYFSASIVLEKGFGRVWFPFVAAGGGYVVNRLDNRRVFAEAEFLDERLDNSPAFHIKPGLRIRPVRRVTLIFAGKFMVYDTERKSRVLWNNDMNIGNYSVPVNRRDRQVMIGLVLQL